MCDSDIETFVDALYLRGQNEFAEISKFLWENPELSTEERKAHDYLVSFLRRKGFQVRSAFLGFETAFRADFEVIPDSEGPVVCFMCEYDALPGIGHACGHNLIAEAGIAAATCAREFLEKHKFPGKIVVMGCPAEENGSYKVHLLEAEAFRDVHLAMMVHPHFTSSELNPNIIGIVSILAEFHSRQIDGAVTGSNALDAAVQSYQSIALLRHQMLPSCKIHSIIGDGGSDPAIIPKFASLEVLVRAPTMILLKDLERRVKQCIESAGYSCDVSVKISHSSPTTLPLNSNRTLAKLFQKYAENMGMEFADITGRGERFSASSDVGSVSWAVPVIQPGFHIDAKGPNHSKEFTTEAGAPSAQPPTLVASRAMAKTAIEILKRPNLVEEMKAELMKSQLTLNG